MAESAATPTLTGNCKLVSMEGEEFSISKQALSKSALCAGMFDADNEEGMLSAQPALVSNSEVLLEGEFPMAQVDTETMVRIVEWLKHFENEPALTVETVRLTLHFSQTSVNLLIVAFEE